MKKIGLIGGMSWESSVVYYELINRKVREVQGGFHSAHCIMESVDFAEIVELQHKNDWGTLDKIMVRAAQNLERAGAEIIILCTNTMHLCSEAIIKNTSVPFLHIAEATGNEIKKQQLKNVLLLGTKFTMEKDFYRKVLNEKFGTEVIVPDETDRETLHKIIYTELVHGKTEPASRQEFQRIIKKAIEKGAEGVILGCTEIPLLIKDSDTEIPVFDTTRIHSESAVEFALA